MTQEQKAYSRQVRRELWNEQKGQIAQDILDDVTESAAMRVESDATQARNRAMSEAGFLKSFEMLLLMLVTLFFESRKIISV